MRLLAIVAEEVCHFVDGAFEHLDARQVDHTEMVRVLPIETGALHDEQFLVVQQIERELLVVANVEFLRIDFREDVEGRLRFDRRDAID